MEQAKTLPNYYKTKENALLFFCDDEERIEMSRDIFDPILWGLVHNLSLLAKAKQSVRYIDMAISILDVMNQEINSKMRIQLQEYLKKARTECEPINKYAGDT